MQASIANGDGLKRIVTIVIEQDQVKSAYEDVVRKITKDVRIDGFRKGHVPRSIVETRFLGDILSRCYDKFFRENVNQALEQVGVKAATRPEPYFEDDVAVNIKPDAAFTFKVSFETFPAEINLDCSALSIKQIQSSIEESDIDKMVENLRSQRAGWKTVDDKAAEKGDRMNLDFTGKKDGEVFEGGSAVGYNQILQEGYMIPGFIDNLIGHKAGDKFSFDITFPEDYHVENLKGQPVTFDIVVNAVAVKDLPELNEEFVKSFGVADGSIETFRNELKSNMEREQDKAMRTQNHQLVFDALLKAAGEFEVPVTWVEDNRINMCNAEQKRIARMLGMKELPSKMADDKNAMAEEALETTRLQWIINEISRTLKVEAPSQDAIEKRLNAYAGAYEDPEEVKAELRKDKEQYPMILRMAYEDELINAVLAKAQVEVENTTFSALISRNQYGA